MTLLASCAFFPSWLLPCYAQLTFLLLGPFAWQTAPWGRVAATWLKLSTGSICNLWEILISCFNPWKASVPLLTPLLFLMSPLPLLWGQGQKWRTSASPLLKWMSTRGMKWQCCLLAGTLPLAFLELPSVVQSLGVEMVTLNLFKYEQPT